MRESFIQDADIPGVNVAGVVRSDAERGVGPCVIAPKSSCVVLLHRRSASQADTDASGYDHAPIKEVDKRSSSSSLFNKTSASSTPSSSFHDSTLSTSGLVTSRRDDSLSSVSPWKPSLVLVAVVHLESAPPSQSPKVRLRRAQMRALLAEVSDWMLEIYDTSMQL